MSLRHAYPGEVVDLPVGAGLKESRTTTLAKTPHLELIRLVLPAGKEIATHSAPNEITVQCLEGLVSFTHSTTTVELRPGQLLYLAAGEPHSVVATQDSSLLVTLLLGKTHGP